MYQSYSFKLVEDHGLHYSDYSSVGKRLIARIEGTELSLVSNSILIFHTAHITIVTIF